MDLVRWSSEPIEPSNQAAIARITNHLFAGTEEGEDFLIQIRFDSRDVSLRNLSAYLSLLDGAYGRTDPSGFRSYALRPSDHLRLRAIAPGSSVLEMLLSSLGDVDPWRFLIIYILARTGPSVLKGEAAKNWSEAVRGAGEAALVWSDVAERFRTRRQDPLRLSRRERRFIRAVIEEDERFAHLSTRDVAVLVDVVAQVIVQERANLARAARFDAMHVLDVALRQLPRGEESEWWRTAQSDVR